MESEKENNESQNKTIQCIICNEQKDFFSIGICNHEVSCLYCTLKCRSFYNDKRCPLCNIILNEVFIFPISEKHNFEELNKNDKSIYFQDDDFENNGVYYIDISSKEESLKLKAFKCPINICLSEPFENFNQLNKHLNENHMKYYCNICLKDGKKFLSEQLIFSKEELKNHIKFGSYKNDIFPHPKCPFCKDLYFNDELLFKHMSQLHFLCEICKNKEKKIIFYSVLPNLVQHNKIKHYCCPYKECVNDLYVSFGTEKEFTGHLISKHHMNDIGGKLHKIIIENQPQEFIYPDKYDISLNKDEFNFSDYIKKLNERYIKHKDDLENKIVIENKFNDNKFDYNDIEIEVIYTNDNNNNNNNNNKNNYKNNNNNNYNNKNKNNNNNNNNDKLNINSTSYIPKSIKGKFKNQDFKQNKNNQIIILDDKNSNHKKSDSLDYEFLFQYYLTIIKDYIINRIKIREVDEDEIKLPKETIYQLIMIINKIETKRKLLELSSIQNFGLPMESINKIKNLLISETNDSNKEKLYIEFDNLTMKNMLILYKYISTALKKINGSFFKLEFEQIDEDLYENFIKRPITIEKKIESKNNSFAINYIVNGNKIAFEQYKSHNHKKKKGKNWNKKNIPGLSGNSNQKITNIYNINNKVNENKKDLNEIVDKKENQNQSLNEIKNESNEEEEKEKEKEIIKKSDSEEDNKKDDIKDKNYKENKNEISKLSMLINNNVIPNDNTYNTNNYISNDKKKYGKKGKKKGKFIDFDDFNNK